MYRLILVLFLYIATVMISSCEKEMFNTTSIDQEISVVDMEPAYSHEEVASIVAGFSMVQKDGKPHTFLQKIGRWFKRRAGTNLFNNCSGSNPCGPCPGICLRFNSMDFGVIDEDYVSSEDYDLGYRALKISLIENADTNEEKIMFVFKNYVQDFIIDDFFYIEENLQFNSELAEIFEKKYITIQKGKYPVVFDELTEHYYSLVEVEMN